MRSSRAVVFIAFVSGLAAALIGGSGCLSSALATGTDRARESTEALRCVAFGPYVGDLDPDFGLHPDVPLIDTLLDRVVSQTGFDCIMTYGVLNGLDYVIKAADQRGLKVIAVIWLDTDTVINDASIEQGTETAKAYPDTVVRLSCGSEFRTRNGVALDGIIRDCIARLRAAGVPQPITSIDTWWEWCARSWPCQEWNLSADVEWIGINVHPWWENKFSGLFPCTTAAEAADFHIARLQDIIGRYPGKEVVLTEFGWPAGPDGDSETNEQTDQHCGVASEENQCLVVRETLAKLDQLGLQGSLFEGFREGDWKSRNEGPVGVFWGLCDGSPPYTCKQDCLPVCGNGVLDPGEQCDPPGNIGQCLGGVDCRTDCTCKPCPPPNPIAGSRLLIRNKLPDDENKNEIVLVAKDNNVTAGAIGSGSDPRCTDAGGSGSGGTLIVSSQVCGQAHATSLPCQDWTLVGKNPGVGSIPKGYKYTDGELDDGTCKVIVIRNGRRVKALCLGKGPTRLDYDLQEGRAQAPVDVVLTAGTQSYCAEFGGSIKKDGTNGKVFKAINASPPSVCP